MDVSKAEKFFDEHMKEGYRDTTTNWLGFVSQVRDGYERFMGVPHGVQKDAIQNGWDARKCKKGTGWSFEFEFISGKGRELFTMSDSGTHGLTGRVITDSKEYYEDMPKELRWARFESLAFTKASAEDLGSRGRGKFIFVAASKENIIFYDTLLEDGTYRLGTRVVTQIGSPVKHWEGEKAKKKLSEITNGLIKPLKKVGARIIISEPVYELVDAIKSGDFEKYVSETWWEIIQKYDAKIYVTVNGKRKRVELPSEYPLPERDEKESGLFVWIKEHQKIPSIEYKIRKLHLVFSEKGVDELLREIAVQRKSMKVTTIKSEYLPKNISDKIFGYVTVDDDLEREIRKYESDEHYSIAYRNYVLQSFRTHVLNEIFEFAKKKLGYGKDPKEVKRERQRTAEQKAIDRINEISSDIGLLAPGKRTKKKEKREVKERLAKPVHFHMLEPEYPNAGTLRINYGEKLGNIGTSIMNNTNKDVKVKMKIFIRFSDRSLKVFVDKNIMVSANSESKPEGPFEETFTESSYPNKGKHILTLTLVSMDEKTLGEKIDKRTRGFYLEQNPPVGGIFEKCKPVKFPDEQKYIMGYAEPGEEGAYVLVYNTEHLEYKENETWEERLAFYLFRLMAYEVCRIDMTSDEPVMFEKEDKEDPEKILNLILDKIGEFIFRYFEKEI